MKKIKEFIQTHVSLFYKGCLFLTVIGLLLFVVPTFLFGSNVYQKDTGIGVANQVQIDQIQFVQLKRSYNPQRQYAEILLKASESIPNNGKLEIVAGELKTRQRIETKLLQLSSNEYVIQLYQIPQTWQDIIIDIGITYATDSYKTIHSLEDIFKEFGQKNQSATERTVQSKLFMAKAKVPKNRSLISKSVTDYQLEMIQLSIKEAQQLVKENQQTISKFLSEIAQIEKQIQVLNKEKKYQTTSEVQATEQLILSKMNRIEEAKGQIQKAEIANKEVQQKIEKLLLQKEDLRKKSRRQMTPTCIKLMIYDIKLVFFPYFLVIKLVFTCTNVTKTIVIRPPTKSPTLSGWGQFCPPFCLMLLQLDKGYWLLMIK